MIVKMQAYMSTVHIAKFFASFIEVAEAEAAVAAARHKAIDRRVAKM